MAKLYLVIFESPGKIKKLKAILGADYEIIASMGHVVDLPRTAFGINVDTMQPEYAVMKADVAKRLRSEAQKPYKIIYLASDPDREGEAISHHIAGLLNRAKTSAKMQRVTFDAITPSAVKAAFAKPRQIDQQLVAAQEARRLLDRLVGFPASRFLWQFVPGKGLSAGRVQSVALRLVVERDQAIATFVPEEYWTITALFKAAGGEFSAKRSQLAFDGFLRLYNYSEEKDQIKRTDDIDSDDDEPINTQLPLLTVGERVQALKLTPAQHFTKPPAPYTEALLVKALEQHGVGRPSTYAQTIATVKERGYVDVDKRKLAATVLGKQVHTVLDSKLKGLFETAFTAQMETALDEIAAGTQNGPDYLRGFWAQVSPLFGSAVIQATLGQKEATTSQGDIPVVEDDQKMQRTARAATLPKTPVSSKSLATTPVTNKHGVCPQCHKPLLKRRGSRGEFLGCSGFPACHFTRNLS